MSPMLRETVSALIAACGVAGGAFASGDNGGTSDGSRVVFTDAVGDATLRRTDPTLAAPLPGALPDLVELTVGGWLSENASTDPYSGTWTTGASADLVRIDLIIGGLVNPPGTLSPFNPAQFGSRPLIGFVEFDADNNRNTGGECDQVDARTRYLGNVARFGALPYGSLGGRAATNASEYTDGFQNGPEFELTGAEFALILCGCFNTTVVNRFSDATPATFDAGETWIVRGRFFQRAGGYGGDASAMFGGTSPGAFDPLVNLRFSHDIPSDRTTVTLVFPLTMAGAASLLGQAQQAPDTSITNHTSVYEALLDIVDSVDFAAPGCQDELMRRWNASDITHALDPSQWNAQAAIGVPYLQTQAFPYAYTDVGFREETADLDSDGAATAMDAAAFDGWLAASDGGAQDADGVVNGVFMVGNFGPNFQLRDFNNDGMVDDADAAFFETGAPCAGDTNGDNVVNFTDLNAVLAAFGQSGVGIPGDLNGDNVVNFTDLNEVLANFGGLCP
jgi:hypothetical protein